MDIPTLGFGTVDLKGDVERSVISAAIQCGYRHIDTASKYGTEPEVGDTVRASETLREALFIATKVTPDMRRMDQARPTSGRRCGGSVEFRQGRYFGGRLLPRVAILLVSRGLSCA